LSLIKLISLSKLKDRRGSLVYLESRREIPFSIKRIYYIFGNKLGINRGFHAHKKLNQVVICIKGNCKIILDNGIRRERVRLNNPTKGLLINKMIWREMHDFTSDCILLIIASEYFVKNDYISNYQNFKKIVKK
jgi:dTDP-4-dehydrorhamnose 3,5-epimerase-like enzyme